MPDPQPKSPSHSIFPTTHWTVVSALRQAPLEERNEMLEVFLDKYQAAFRFHLLHGRGIKHEQDLEDTLQGFITDKFIAKSILDYVEQDGGRLRDYLRRSLDNYVYSQHRSKAAVAWDRRESHGEQHPGASSDDAPPCSFDIAWARSVMVEAVLRAKDQFFYGKRPHIWEVIDLRHIRPIFLGCAPASYDELSETIGVDKKAIQNYRITGLRALDKHLRETVAEYVGDNQDEIQQEMFFLNKILRDAGISGHFASESLDT